MMDFPSVRTVYGSLESMLAKFDKYSRRSRFTGGSREELEAWQRESKKTLSGLLGLHKMDEAPLIPSRTESVSLPGGIVRERWVIQTEPHVFMPFYLLIPEKRKEAFPILCPPGHGGMGKYTVAGLSEYLRIRERIEFYHYDYGLFFARNGYAALCPDARGFGERRESLSDAGKLPEAMMGDCRRLANMGNPLGIPVAGMLVWDLCRAIDFLLWHGEWDTSRLLCAGFSGGGMQTLFLAALEERVKGAFISGYFYGYRDSLLRQNENCACNYVPGLWEHFDMGDIAALIAPRPLHIQSCREDRQNGPRGIDNVADAMAIVRSAYELYGAQGRLWHEICPGPHRFHEETAARSIDRMLKECAHG